MNIEDLREYCLLLSNTTEGVKWESNLAFMLFEKIFLLASIEAQPTRITFKVSQEDFNEIEALAGCGQAPYFAKRQWICVEDISRFSDEDLKGFVQNSYNLIKAKLPKKLQIQCK